MAWGQRPAWASARLASPKSRSVGAGVAQRAQQCRTDVQVGALGNARGGHFQRQCGMAGPGAGGLRPRLQGRVGALASPSAACNRPRPTQARCAASASDTAPASSRCCQRARPARSKGSWAVRAGDVAVDLVDAGRGASRCGFMVCGALVGNVGGAGAEVVRCRGAGRLAQAATQAARCHRGQSSPSACTSGCKACAAGVSPVQAAASRSAGKRWRSGVKPLPTAAADRQLGRRTGQCTQRRQDGQRIGPELVARQLDEVVGVDVEQPIRRQRLLPARTAPLPARPSHTKSTWLCSASVGQWR